MTTAGNLVIQVVPDGRLVAYSADKGEKLLEVQTGLRGGMGPPITYQLDGKQYISLMGGTGPLPRFNPGGAGGGRGGRGGNNAAPGGTGNNAAAGTAGGNAPGGATPPPPPGTAEEANAQAADAAPPGFGTGPQVLPKLLTFVLDGKTPLPTPTPAPVAETR